MQNFHLGIGISSDIRLEILFTATLRNVISKRISDDITTQMKSLNMVIHILMHK